MDFTDAFAKQLVYEKQNVCYTSIHDRIEPRVAMGASGTTQWVGEASGRGFGDRRRPLPASSMRFFLFESAVTH
jgi:hypothetical protein